MQDGQYIDKALIAVDESVPNALSVTDEGLRVTADALVSEDPDNQLKAQDGKLYVAPVEQSVVSADEGNIVREGTDGGAFMDGNDLLSNGDINLLTISEVDHKIILRKKDVLANLPVVSDDPGNLIGTGSDGGAYMSKDELISEDEDVLTTDSHGKLVTELGMTYDQLSGKLTITGVDGTEVATATIPSSTSALKGVELVNGMPSAEGDEVAGDYHLSVMLKDNNGAWTDPVGVTVNTTKGSLGNGPFSVAIPSGGTTVAAVRAIFMGDDKQQTGASSPISVVFDDTSTAAISWTVQDQNINGSVSFTPQIGIKAGTYLHFVWLLSDGSVRDTYVDVTDLIDIYTAGQGIAISGKEISVKLGAGSGIEFDGTGNIVFNAQAVFGDIVDNIISTDANNALKKGTDNKLVVKPVSTDAGNLATTGSDAGMLVTKEGITDAVKEIVTESLASPDTSLACDMISETAGNQLVCDNGKLMVVSDYGTM